VLRKHHGVGTYPLPTRSLVFLRVNGAEGGHRMPTMTKTRCTAEHLQSEDAALRFVVSAVRTGVHVTRKQTFGGSLTVEQVMIFRDAHAFKTWLACDDARFSYTHLFDRLERLVSSCLEAEVHT